MLTLPAAAPKRWLFSKRLLSLDVDVVVVTPQRESTLELTGL